MPLISAVDGSPGRPWTQEHGPWYSWPCFQDLLGSSHTPQVPLTSQSFPLSSQGEPRGQGARWSPALPPHGPQWPLCDMGTIVAHSEAVEGLVGPHVRGTQRRAQLLASSR